MSLPRVYRRSGSPHGGHEEAVVRLEVARRLAPEALHLLMTIRWRVRYEVANCADVAEVVGLRDDEDSLVRDCPGVYRRPARVTDLSI